ncbi:MAG: hypothetical protein OES69_09145 [Myxococcales bacterium]|nr:hypothetical protein [Myxococcales bacterium]MDH3844091.1 hypothetical protein [Myxococcales bacterium]
MAQPSKTQTRSRKALSLTTQSAAFFVPIILAASYLNAGPTCCGSNCPPRPYPEHLQIDLPILEIVDRASGENEEPYFVTMIWEATSAKAVSGGTADGSTKVRVTRGDLPAQVRRNARISEQVLLGEDISHAVFDFPDVPETAFAGLGKHVKIAGLTTCGFEQDDANQLGSILTEFGNLAAALEATLDNVYSENLFGSTQTKAAFRQVATVLRSQATTAFNALTAQQRAQNTPLYEQILAQIDDFIELIDQGIDNFQPKIGVGAVLGIVGGALEVLPNIISLFRKKHTPDNDDFVGCASVIFVGVPFTVWDSMDESNDSTCSLGEGGYPVLVCAIDEYASTILRFAEPFDATESRHWKANVDARRGLWRTSSDANYPRGTAHRYQVVSVQQSAETVDTPVAKSRPVCPEGVHQGECEIHFAHMVNYETFHDDWFNYEIIEKPSKRYEILTEGRNDYPNVGVRLSTVTLPSYVEVRREVIELSVVGSQVDTQESYYPPGYASSPDVIMIPEIMSIQREGELQSSINLTMRKQSDRTELKLHGNGGCFYWGCSATRVKVRVTYLYWDSAAPVDLYQAVVQSDDDQSTGPQEPERADMHWTAPFLDEHVGAPLYFPMEIWSGDDKDMGFSLRATGTEVKDTGNPDAWLYAQDYYAGSEGYVKAKIVNLRFR